jgi:cysteinyl-tRNA synthetase
MTDTPLRLFNSLTRELETFTPLNGNEARVYTCGPTVYNYQHIGNMRAYVFADTLGRVLRFKGYDLKHVINITDVGHLTSDADAGDDKMEKAAAAQGKTAWDIAKFYQADFEADLARLNIRKPQHPRATDYVEAMIEWAKSIEAKHCYRLDSGLYFDTATVPDYGRLARANTDDGQSRIDPVAGKRQPQDFAIWRTTPPGETRQMEWDSPWGRGAPGWHIECSVMSKALLGFPFDIHTGGIDHREVHHPCEIAQNQARCPDLPSGAGTGAKIWMHNNFLIDRRGKMSKSSGEFLRLQTLVDRGFHPLAYRLMCLQAHYRSEMEFTWEGLAAAFVRLKRMVIGANVILHKDLLTADWDFDADQDAQALEDQLDQAISNDLNTSNALVVLDQLLSNSKFDPFLQGELLEKIDNILGLDLMKLTRQELRIRPKSAIITEEEIETALAARARARKAKQFAKADGFRDNLIAKGVEVMDGDPLGWDWKLDI